VLGLNKSKSIFVPKCHARACSESKRRSGLYKSQICFGFPLHQCHATPPMPAKLRNRSIFKLIRTKLLVAKKKNKALKASNEALKASNEALKATNAQLHASIMDLGQRTRMIDVDQLEARQARIMTLLQALQPVN